MKVDLALSKEEIEILDWVLSINPGDPDLSGLKDDSKLFPWQEYLAFSTEAYFQECFHCKELLLNLVQMCSKENLRLHSLSF